MIILKTPPHWITIGITNICNNSCVFCSYHCKEAKGKSNVYSIPFKMPFSDFKRIVDMANLGQVPFVHICATGEPFFHENIIDMIDYSIKVYGKASVQTNFFKPLFEKNNYLEKLIERKEYMSFITTDIVSGDPFVHDKLKRGSSYHDVMAAIEFLSNDSNIRINISYVLTVYNYLALDKLINDLVRRGINNASINIHNLYPYDFNQYSSFAAVYHSKNKEITAALEQARLYGQSKGINVSIPVPADLEGKGCTVFWEKIQIWPVKGNDPDRYHENLIPHACPAVVKGNLSSLGYLFDYKNIMEMWNSEKIVNIRKNLLAGQYPSPECIYCYHYSGPDSIYKKNESQK